MEVDAIQITFDIHKQSCCTRLVFHRASLPCLFSFRIVFALSQTELCVCDLAALLNLSDSAVSHQLRLLRSLRLVKYRKVGRLAYYSLDDDHSQRLLLDALEHVRQATA